jgi:hypothetical protein
MKSENCPSCGLLLKAGSCNSCGYAQELPAGSDHYCAWSGCPLMGSITDTRGGKGATWYCNAHYFNRDNPNFCRQATDKFNRGEMLPSKKRWSDALLEETMEALRATNPELFYRPTSQSEMDEYQAMMVNFIKSRKPAIKKLPYQKTKQQDYDENALIHDRRTIGETV